MWYRGWFAFTGLNAAFWTAIVVALAAVWWFSAMYLRGGDGHSYDSPSRLFRDLCRAHRLSKREIELLRRLAQERDLETPSLMFVRDEYFADGGEEARQLRERLFAA